MLGDGSTAVTCLQRSARGSANLPAPAPTSSSVVAGDTSCARRLTSMSSVRCGSALKKEEKGSQRSWPVTPKADRILCDCSRCAVTRCFQASSADMLESPPHSHSEAAYPVWLTALPCLVPPLDESQTSLASSGHRPREYTASGQSPLAGHP